MKWFSILLLASPLWSQSSGNVTMILFPGTPSGSCNSRQIALNQATGQLYTCNASAWQVIAGGPGGGGGVSNFSAGNLANLFTTNVSNPTTTPNLAFTLSQAPAQSMLGNATSASGLPTWITIPTGGGSNPLNGCTTPSLGVLICDNSIQGGTGPVALITLPYASTGLPAPPAGAAAGIAANASGQLFTSTGNGAAFLPISSGGGGGNGAASSLVFGSNSLPLSNSIPGNGQFLMYDGSQILGATINGGGGPTGGVTIVN